MRKIVEVMRRIAEVMHKAAEVMRNIVEVMRRIAKLKQSIVLQRVEQTYFLPRMTQTDLLIAVTFQNVQFLSFGKVFHFLGQL